MFSLPTRQRACPMTPDDRTELTRLIADVLTIEGPTSEHQSLAEVIVREIAAKGWTISSPIPIRGPVPSKDRALYVVPDSPDEP